MMVALFATGCSGGGTSLYVRNDSPQAWYLRVPRTQHPDSSLWVVKVSPGADAFALAWQDGDAVAVSVLALDCTVVGSFRPAPDGSLLVEGVPGLVGHIEQHGAPPGSRLTTPGVEDTEECGGFLGR
jgi:hypothetical protein